MPEKYDQVASEVRTAILRGDYADGERLPVNQIAKQQDVHNSVVGQALYMLEYEGLISRDTMHHYHVNASYLARQLQMVLIALSDIRALTSVAMVALKQDPANVACDYALARERLHRRRVTRPA